MFANIPSVWISKHPLHSPATHTHLDRFCHCKINLHNYSSTRCFKILRGTDTDHSFLKLVCTKFLYFTDLSFGLLLFSRSVMSDSLWPHGLQHTRLPCPSPTPRACSNSCSSSQWCHPTISSSVTHFSSCPQTFQPSRSFLMSQFFASGGQILELQQQSFQWISRVDFL